jgi:ribulose-phosphate 3-epimerase
MLRKTDLDDLPAATRHSPCPREKEFLDAGNGPTIPSDACPLVVETLPANSARQRFATLRDGGPAVIPSLLLCDFGHLADEVHRLEAAGVRGLHLDVMDGHFVPNLTYGLPIVEAVRRVTELPIETHLMISDPATFAPQFVAAGADCITFHIEALAEPGPVLAHVRSLGAAVGLAYNPATPLAAVQPYLDACDLILTMSVHPGFGGQSFESGALEKLRQLRDQAPAELLLEVDGGVNNNTIGHCAAAGATLHVVGSAIFKHPDYSQSIATLTSLAQHPPRTY